MPNEIHTSVQTSWKNKHWNFLEKDNKDHSFLSVFEKKLTQENQSTQDIYDPFLLKNIDKALDRIITAIDTQEKIMIFGDFDTDGITATSIFVHSLKQLGAKVSYKIPERAKDSHGLKNYLIDEIKETGSSLIITCDCGINDFKEVEYAVELGLDIIITDHHTPDLKRFPKKALAVINPQLPDCPYPNNETSGSVVAFKIIQALVVKLKKLQKTNIVNFNSFLKPYLELAVVGLIADCMPMLGENKKLAKLGLEQLKNPQWLFLQKLFLDTSTHPESINEQTIGFTIAPHLNAASRIGDVRQAVLSFLGEDCKIEARLKHLQTLNNERRVLTEIAQNEAYEQLNLNQNYQIIISDKWGKGILGLVAGRLCEELQQPIIACRLEENGSISASCRSTDEVSIIEILNQVSEDLNAYGGHDGAAGFHTDMTQWKSLNQHLSEIFEKMATKTPEVLIFSELKASDISLNSYKKIRTLAPFGQKNPEPNFLLKNVKIINIKTMGENQNHIRIDILHENKPQQVVAFFAENLIPRFELDQELDLVVNLSENWWQEKQNLQLRLVDVRNIAI